MARVPLIDVDDPNADPNAVALLRTFADGNGDILNVNRALANHPELLEKLAALFAVTQSGGLNERQRELPYLTSAIAIECFY